MEYDRVGLDWHVDWVKTMDQVIPRVFMVGVLTNLTSTIIIYLLETVVAAIVW